MKKTIQTQLSIMMFLQFFIWGAWFVTLSTYLGIGLGFGATDISKAYSTMPWGAIIAPLFVGMIADRFFSAQKVLGALHLIGGGILFYATRLQDASLIFWTLFAYALCYNPTLALVNAISFNQMEDPEKEFPIIRVLGTIGWIVAGLTVGFLKIEDSALPMKIAAATSIALGIYSFFLPKTPPKSLGHRVTVSDVLGLKTLQLLKNRSFAIFVGSSLLICIPLAFYYNFTNLFLNEVGVQNAAAKMTMGQMSEIVFMLVIPFFFVRLGVKKMLFIGMAAWALRYVLFAFGNPTNLVFMYYGGILLHGICYDFFFVTGQIYVDKKAPKQIQASAQGFIALVTYGVGMVIGAWASGLVVQKYQTLSQAGEITGHLWKNIWLVPAAMAIIILIMFTLLFKDDKQQDQSQES